jgi:hypothetical protein
VVIHDWRIFFIYIPKISIAHCLDSRGVASGDWNPRPFRHCCVTVAASGRLPVPARDGDIEDEVLKEFIAEVDSNVTWKDRVSWFCFAGAAILLLILLFR